jgi:hypothetical protein
MRSVSATHYLIPILVTFVLFASWFACSSAISQVGDRDAANAEKGIRPFAIFTDTTLATLRRSATSNGARRRDAWTKLQMAAVNAASSTFAPESFRDSVEFGHASRLAATAARDLLLVGRVDDNRQYCERAKAILLQWTRFEPMIGTELERVPYGSSSQDDGASTAGLGLNIGIAAYYWSELYCLVWPNLTPSERIEVSDWLRQLAELIEEGHRYWIDNDYYNEQNYNNHLSGHLLGLAAVGYATMDEQLIAYAYDSPNNPRDFKEMLHGTILMPSKGRKQFWRSDPGKATQPGEIYDRYRVLTKRGGKGHGLGYATMHLRLLVILAEIANAHGTDYYSHTGPQGENLLLPLEFYSAFYITHSPAAKGAYHAGDRLFMHNLPVFTIGNTRYPDSKAIQDVLAANRQIVLPSDELGYAVHLIYPSKPTKPTQ